MGENVLGVECVLRNYRLWAISYRLWVLPIASCLSPIAYLRKIVIETSLFYKPAICLPYFVIDHFCSLPRILPLSPSMRGIKGEGCVAKISAVPDRFNRGQLAGFPKNQCLFWVSFIPLHFPFLFLKLTNHGNKGRFGYT